MAKSKELLAWEKYKRENGLTDKSINADVAKDKVEVAASPAAGRGQGGGGQGLGLLGRAKRRKKNRGQYIDNAVKKALGR